MSNNYELNVVNGKVPYLTKSGKDNVLMHAPLDNALWILKRGKPENKIIPGQPEYPICIVVNGIEYFFAGIWENDGGIFSDEPEPHKKAGRAQKNVLSE